ncbi:hypothetical protein Poli38472_013420 [Pythium oligandrum]|uniref:Uncharacterized protein n=1 Tax=Pythium oligandrum TaxID=41045 RepID=A0A8K1FD55_PYTOL|nr:hypothetical protein Poli38472_013420 [Pythium oligandrum]|eukprot:TMW57946.1 hypothetical protein Poli38472_013420 [Pythium oligandrum]
MPQIHAVHEAHQGPDNIVSIRDAHSNELHAVSVPHSDISQCVRFSYLRCLLSFLSILLVISDIPRTGFNLDLKAYYPVLAPGIITYYGPYDYPVSHIVRDNASSYRGESGGVQINETRVWSYKYDSVSIGLRGLVQLLGVQNLFLPCLLYEEECETETLELETVFTMLDKLFNALEIRYFHNEAQLPVVFQATSNWIDRLHHVLGRSVKPRVEKRLHTIHRYSGSVVSVCAPDSRRPDALCDTAMPWRCQHPIDPTKDTVSVAEHVDLRFAALQDRYPTLQLELFVFSARLRTQNSAYLVLPSVRYASDTWEFITFIRGRACATCETVFLDEYRYERSILESDASEWTWCLQFLRGAGQVYVWLRVMFAVWGCFHAQLNLLWSWKKCFLVTFTTFFKIPSHVIVYSSWFPVVCYSLAHLIDCGLVHLISDNVWSSLNGFVQFNLLSYVLVASIQMRNVWILALFWKSLLWIHTLVNPRAQHWRPAMGILGIRGIFLTFASWLTIFSFMRAVRFRNTDILSVDELPRHSTFGDVQLGLKFINHSEFGLALDVKTTLITTVIVGLNVFFVQSTLRLLTQHSTHFLFCRSFFVPLSAGTLFPASMLNVFWFLPRQSTHHQYLTARETLRTILLSQQIHRKVIRPRPKACEACSPTMTALHWRQIQGCSRHDALDRIDKRPIALWSVVCLVNLGHDDIVSIHDAHSGELHAVSVPRSNISQYIRFSYVRCVLSLFSILLVVSDIPRTGFSLDLQTYFPVLAPGIFAYYGPYDYPVAHIVRDNASLYRGVMGDEEIDETSVWTYKYDTVSIPLRALAKYLHIPAFPPCILYKNECATESLGLDAIFTMLDALLHEIDKRYFSTKTNLPVVFHVTNNWIDRLHHILGRPLSSRVEKRLHTVHRYSGREVSVCSPSPQRPYLLCDDGMSWRCQHPTNTSKGHVPINEHIDLRFLALQQQHPTLELDLYVFTTRLRAQSYAFPILPTVFYESQSSEVIALVRGRACAACDTVFLDEYRYERATLETDANEWTWCLRLLRGAGQLYVWMRVFFAWWGCFHAESSADWKTRCRVAFTTFFKIPSHIIVYGSWFPVVCYALAHFIDCGVVHLVSDNVWNSLNGFVQFNLLSYVLVASVQMRNVWFISLFWKCVLWAHTRLNPRAQRWRPALGILGIRGIFITFASWLTIFSFVRAIRFRDTNVLSVTMLPRHTPLDDVQTVTAFLTYSEFGFLLDIKTTLITSTIVAASVCLAQSFVRLVTQHSTQFLFCRSFFVPLSAGTLFPASMLNVFWYLPRHSTQRPYMTVRETLHAILVAHKTRRNVATPRSKVCETCSPMMTVLHWRHTQGCEHHDALELVEVRSTALWSVVCLVNVGMLSDPLVVFDLYVLGRSLAIVQVGDSLLVLPWEASNSSEHRSFRFVGLAHSNDLPWRVLVHCG